MQANLLSRREDIVLRGDVLTVAIDAALSIHIMVTNRSDRSWVRIVPDRCLSLRPMFLFAPARSTTTYRRFVTNNRPRLSRERGNDRRAFQLLGPALFHPPNGKSTRDELFEESASFLSGSPTVCLAAWQMRKTWCKRHLFAGRKLTPPKSSPHQPSQIGAGQQGDTTFPNFLTDPCQRA